MRETFSVAELAEAVADPLYCDDVSLITRQIRYWTAIGLVGPEGDTFTGTGRHRKYNKALIPKVARLVRFASFGTSAATLKKISAFLDNSDDWSLADVAVDAMRQMGAR